MIELIYIRFDKNLDYKAVVNSFYIKKFAEAAFCEFPTFISPTKFEFDRNELEKTVQEQYDKSIEYISDSRKLPQKMIEDYYSAIGKSGEDLKLIDFEADLGILDDHIVTINKGNEVLGFMATKDDFEKLIKE